MGLVVDGTVGFVGRSLGLSEKGISEKTRRALEDRKSEEEEALITISKLKEVSDFSALLQKTGKSNLGMMFNSYPSKTNPYYGVRVFENFPDRIVTFGFYRYYPDAKELYKWDPSKYYNWILIEQ